MIMMTKNATCEVSFDSDYSSMFTLPRLCPIAKVHNFYAQAYHADTTLSRRTIRVQVRRHINE